VLIDNRNISVGDITYLTGTTYKVWINNQEIGMIKKGERKLVRVTGISHKIVVEKFKDKVLTGRKYEKRFRLKTNETATLNIPAMINNANEWITKTN